MAETHDTIKSLLAEFRGYSAFMPPSYHVTMSWHDFRKMLDRLEAAHKLETVTGSNQLREALDKARRFIDSSPLVSIVDDTGTIVRGELCAEIDAAISATATAEKSSAVGDAAKLREALKHIKDRLPHMLQYMRVYWEDASAGGYFDELMLVIDAALASPPRNCDRFATVDEARKAHEAICEKYGKCHNGCPLNNEEHYSAFDCFEAWLFAPATVTEGGGK